MQRTDIAAAFDARRADPNDDLFSSTEINAAYDEFGRYLIDKLHIKDMEVSASFTFTEGTTEYQLSAVSADFKDVIDVFYTNNYRFAHVYPDQFKKLSASQANIFSVDGSTLYMNTTFGSGDLRLRYYSKFPAKTSGGYRERSMSDDTSEPIWDEESFSDVYNDWALMRMKQMEGGTEKTNEASQLFKSIQMKLDALNGPSRKSVPKTEWGYIGDDEKSGVGLINTTTYIL